MQKALKTDSHQNNHHSHRIKVAVAGSLARGAGDPLINMGRRIIGNAAITEPQINRILIVRHNDKWVLPGGKQKDLRGWEGLVNKIKSDLPGIEMEYTQQKPIEVTARGRTGPLVTAIVYNFHLVRAPKRIHPFSRIQEYEWTDMTEEGYVLSELMQKIFRRLRQINYIPARELAL